MLPMAPVANALVIGATGNLGHAVAMALTQHGWKVRALTRHDEPGHPAIEWIKGDAMQARDVLQAAQGAHAIVHAANPPGYRRWRELALPMLDHALAAARAHGARLLLPGNVYNFGPDAGPVVDEASPQTPLTAKGQVRREMEQRMADAAADGVRCLVVRAGDFFGGSGDSSWFNQLWRYKGEVPRRLYYPGNPDVGHAWAYLPDLAETMARVLDVDRQQPGRLAPFEVLHFGGHWLPRGVEMAHAVARALGHPDLPVKPFPWRLVQLGQWFVPVLREILEMRYLWDTPLRLDNARLLHLLGDEPHTPLDQAVRVSLGLGDTACLAAVASTQSARAG